MDLPFYTYLMCTYKQSSMRKYTCFQIYVNVGKLNRHIIDRENSYEKVNEIVHFALDLCYRKIGLHWHFGSSLSDLRLAVRLLVYHESVTQTP